MSHQQDVLEHKCANQVVHIRTDSETKLDELFNAVIRPKDHQVPLTVPMRLRNLPPSFFQQPGSQTPSSTDNNSKSNNQLLIHHPRAHSSPASLQQSYVKPIHTHANTHHKQRSFGDLLDQDEESPLPLGWEKAKTSTGQTYFLNHLTQTTTWVDPRKKQLSTTSATSPVQFQTTDELPKGWEKATTLEGETYFINHIDRTTSWLDPRIPSHLQTPPTVAAPISVFQAQNMSQPGSKTIPPQTAKFNSSQMTLQQSLRVHSLEMEREQLRLRQQEIIQQQNILLRQSFVDKLTLAPKELSSSLDSFLEGTDFHSRQESADSGLGLGNNYSLSHTPDEFLTNTEDDANSNDLGLCVDNMDTDDLVPSLQEELTADILSDMEALLLPNNKDSVLTWL